MALPELRTLDVNQPMVNYLSGQARQKQDAVAAEQTGYERDRQATQDAFQQEKYQNTLNQQGIEQETARLKQEMALDPFMKSKADEFIANVNPDDPAFNQKVSDYFDMTGQRAKQLGFSDGSIQSAIQQAISSNAFTPDAIRRHRAEDTKTGKPTKQKTGAYLIKDKDGNTMTVVGSFDTRSGKLENVTSPLPEGYKVVSKLGETGAELTERKIEEKREKVRATGEEGRSSSLIERGISAAEGYSTIKRGIELLNEVKTGGISNVAMKARRFFGAEGANEGELSNSLGKAVLTQLRETFGAAFTVGEGDKLDALEAGFSKSPENNKRILGQLLRMTERTANRALRTAKRNGDDATVADIEELLAFNLSIDAGAEQEPQPSAPVAPQVQPPAPTGQTIEVTNPTTGEVETWDLTTEQRIK